MAAFWFTGSSYVSTLSEIVGHRSGLALSVMKMRKLLASDGEGAHAWPRRMEDGMRVRAEEFEQNGALPSLLAGAATKSFDVWPVSLAARNDEESEAKPHGA